MSNKFLMIVVIVFASVLCVIPAFADVREVLRTTDGKIISFEQMMDDLEQASVVFVGESHDEPSDHAAQLDIIRALEQSGNHVAIGMEMFRTESQAALDSWVEGTLPIDRFIQVYYDNWRMPWPLYGDILLYAREQRIPTRGLNIPEGISKKIAEHGFESLSAEEKKQLPPGIGCNVDPTYMEFIKRAYAGSHAHGDQEFTHFCEAQMVWDKSMAWNLAEYLGKHPDKTMVVLAGIGHAWKRGIAGQLPVNANLSYRVVLPENPDESRRPDVTVDDADYVLLS